MYYVVAIATFIGCPNIVYYSSYEPLILALAGKLSNDNKAMLKPTRCSKHHNEGDSAIILIQALLLPSKHYDTSIITCCWWTNSICPNSHNNTIIGHISHIVSYWLNGSIYNDVYHIVWPETIYHVLCNMTSVSCIEQKWIFKALHTMRKFVRNVWSGKLPVYHHQMYLLNTWTTWWIPIFMSCYITVNSDSLYSWLMTQFTGNFRQWLPHLMHHSGLVCQLLCVSLDWLQLLYHVWQM